MSIHPLQPFYVAMGLGDGTTCIMDRRMSRDPFSRISSDQLAHQACSFRYKLDRSRSKPHKITSVKFNDCGSELLVSFSEDYLYLFNSHFLGCGGSSSSNKKEIKQLLTYKNASSKRNGRTSSTKCNQDSMSSSGNATTNAIPPARNEESSPPIKRVRLRGDWSDTGPQARPEENIDDSQRSIFMDRMSDIFTRWIGEALNDSTDSDQVLNTTDNSSSLEEQSADSTSTLEDSFESTSESCDSFINSTSVLTSAMASCSTSSRIRNANKHHDQEPCGDGSHSLSGQYDGSISSWSTCTTDNESDASSKHGDISETDSNELVTHHSGTSPSVSDVHTHMTSVGCEPIDISMKRDLHSTIDESVTHTYPEVVSHDHCPTVEGSHSPVEDGSAFDSNSTNTKVPLSSSPSPSWDEQLRNSCTDHKAENCSEDEHSHRDLNTLITTQVHLPNDDNPINTRSTKSPSPSWDEKFPFPSNSFEDGSCDKTIDHEETCYENEHIRHSNRDRCVDVNDHIMQYRGHRNARTMVCITLCSYIIDITHWFHYNY